MIKQVAGLIDLRHKVNLGKPDKVIFPSLLDPLVRRLPKHAQLPKQ